MPHYRQPSTGRHDKPTRDLILKYGGRYAMRQPTAPFTPLTKDDFLAKLAYHLNGWSGLTFKEGVEGWSYDGFTVAFPPSFSLKRFLEETGKTDYPLVRRGIKDPVLAFDRQLSNHEIGRPARNERAAFTSQCRLDEKNSTVLVHRFLKFNRFVKIEEMRAIPSKSKQSVKAKRGSSATPSDSSSN